MLRCVHAVMYICCKRGKNDVYMNVDAIMTILTMIWWRVASLHSWHNFDEGDFNPIVWIEVFDVCDGSLVEGLWPSVHDLWRIGTTCICTSWVAFESHLSDCYYVVFVIYVCLLLLYCILNFDAADVKKQCMFYEFLSNILFIMHLIIWYDISPFYICGTLPWYW